VVGYDHDDDVMCMNFVNVFVPVDSIIITMFETVITSQTTQVLISLH